MSTLHGRDMSLRDLLGAGALCRRTMACALAAALGVIGAVNAAASQDGPRDHSHDRAPERRLEDTPSLSVRGSAELRRPADRANLSIAVHTEHADPGRALDLNNEAVRRVIEEITAAGLEASEFETGRFFIRPTYSRRPRTPAEDWRLLLLGYEVSNVLTVRTLKLPLVGAIVEAANKAGANNVSVTGFDLADPAIHRQDAIEQATRQAITEAQTLARAAGLHLVRVTRITLDSADPRPSEMAFTAGVRMAADSAGPPIVAGDVTINASVHIVYEIRDLVP